MENKLADLPQEMLDEIIRSTDFDLDFPLSSDFAVFDGNPSPAPEALEVANDAPNGTFETLDALDGGDVTEMQALDPNTLIPVRAEEVTMAFLDAVDLEDGAVTFAVLAEEEVEEEVVEFPEISTVEEIVPEMAPQNATEGEGDEEEDSDDEDWEAPPPPPPSRKRTRSRRDPSEPPRKRGRKPLYPPGTPRPSRRRPRKVKLYEREAFQDPEEERKRVNALNAKLHRQKKKEEKEQLEEQLKEVRRERDLLRSQLEQMRQREQLLLKELESQQQQQQQATSSRRFTATQTLNVC